MRYASSRRTENKRDVISS